jgi:ubiquinone/menaquinone biosynthesis C-methylase UbiE
MDDPSLSGERLLRALDELRLINLLLGGYTATIGVLRPYLASRSGQPVRILDMGTGVADFPEQMLRFAQRLPLPPLLEITGVDVNPAVVEYAHHSLSLRLPDRLLDRVRVQVADGLALPFKDGAFDVAVCAMTLHHFPANQAVRVLSELARVSRDGIVVNDLYRHPLAYLGFRAFSSVLSFSEMVRRDGALSVRRGFTRDELNRLAAAARLRHWTVRAHWAFRWTLSTLKLA